jgi:hypothetical protein
MQFITPTNDRYARIGFADTYAELPDEYNYAQAPAYRATFSNADGGFWDLFSTKSSREKKEAGIEATKAKTELDKAIANALNAPEPKGMGTGGKILVGVSVVALVGITIWALKR